VADNLQRAAEAVPAGVVDGDEQLEAEKAQRLLKSLLQGVRMTEGVLINVRGPGGRMGAGVLFLRWRSRRVAVAFCTAYTPRALCASRRTRACADAVHAA
jgi:hypothetical protein